MKVQCSCGAKYQFDITPDMAQNPVKFVCPACGADSSEFVNTLVRQELGQPTIPSAPAPQPVPVPNPSPAPIARSTVRVRTHNAEPAQTESASEEPTGAPCAKHPGHFAIEKCCVCSKPICPKCMELFGYVCSPLCKAKAESHGINIPAYEGQKSVVEAKLWRKVGRIAAGICAVILGLLGFWIWFAWFGSEPKPVFSVRFPQPAYSGQSTFLGKDQIVFLHGATLARHDLKKKKEIWVHRVIDDKQIEAEVAREIRDIQASIARANQQGLRNVPSMLSPEELREDAERAAEAALELRVQGSNIWVLSPGKLVRYDYNTGNPAKEIPVQSDRGELISRGDELLMMEETGPGKQLITHISLTTCDSRSEEVGGPSSPPPDSDITTAALAMRTAAPSGARGSATAGLPVGTPGKDAGKIMDPTRVAAQAQRLSRPAKIALPALLANSMNQERILEEINEDETPRAAAGTVQAEPEQKFSLLPTKDGFLQFSVKLLESRIVERAAMKAKPTRSVLDGNLNVTQTTEVANEILNDMQRSRGGDVMREDESRYLVKVRRADGTGEWSGEVVGRPALFPLKTVNVLAANKVVYVFNKDNKKLWQSPLGFNIDPSLPPADEENSLYGQGPCVEHKGGLYVFDQGVLTAFDLASGNVRWRLPSVGIRGLFFDDQDMMYVNTTTATPDKLKYSRQIDISDVTMTEVFKIDSNTGKTIWREHLGGFISYVSGKFVYTLQSYKPDDDEGGTGSPLSGFETPAHVRIKRINPRNGREMWEHYQDRAPLDVGFEKNTIRLVFKKEVQVLKFVSF